MEENPIISMERTGKIIRKSIFTFLKHYQFLTSMATMLALPFALSVLISQAFLLRSSVLFPVIHGHLHSLFEAAGFPGTSGFFTLISLKLSQTFSSSIVTFPFAISFLLLAKASVISSIFNKQSSFISLYNPLLSTHICNCFVIFSANASCISLVFLAFTFLESFQITSSKWVLFVSAIAAVFYSIVLANALVICNLALISSSMEKEKRGGFIAILRSCILIRGKTATALALALPINIGLASIEALFNVRIMTYKNLHVVTHSKGIQLWLVVLEGIFIAFLYSIILVLDVIMSCFFYQSCRKNYMSKKNEEYNYEKEEKLKEVEENV